MTSELNSRPRRNRHARQHRRRRGPKIFTLVALAMALFIGTAVASVYTQVQSQINSADINDLLGTDRPGSDDSAPDPEDSWDGDPLNVLVLGSDYRGGDNSQYGDFEGMRSDTALIMHVSADRERLDVVSIPRDLIVEIPACQLPDGGESAPQPLGTDEHNGVRFNAAFSTGGQGEDPGYAAACAILTVEAMTDIYIDDWAVVDMDGFSTMVDAIGGVDMCFDEALTDPKADLKLDAGCQTLDGEQSLGLARARKGLGDGSDLGRINRQQELMGAMVDQVLSAGTLANPSKSLNFISSAASSLTTSERLGNLNNLTGLGYSLRKIDSDQVNFATIPYAQSGNVVLQTDETDLIWEALRADEPMPSEAAEPGEDPESPDEPADSGDSGDPDDSGDSGDPDDSGISADTGGASSTRP